MPTMTASDGAQGPVTSAAGLMCRPCFRLRPVHEHALWRREQTRAPDRDRRAIAMGPEAYGKSEKAPSPTSGTARRAASAQDLLRALDSEESRPSAGRAGRTSRRTTGNPLSYKALRHEYLGVRFNLL
jgi:hypothetical protein